MDKVLGVSSPIWVIDGIRTGIQPKIARAPVQALVMRELKKVKVKFTILHKGSIGGCSSPSPRPWARRWRTTNVCDVWPVRRQTYGYLPIRKASPPIGWCPNYTTWWQRHMCVNNLPRVALNSGEAGIRTSDLLISSPHPNHSATEPHNEGVQTIKGLG